MNFQIGSSPHTGAKVKSKVCFESHIHSSVKPRWNWKEENQKIRTEEEKTRGGQKKKIKGLYK